MKKIGVAILGLGTVGGGTYKILTSKKEKFINTFGTDVTVENVLEINDARIKQLNIDQSIVTKNIAEVVSNPAVDVVVEVIGGIEPAKTFIETALKHGKTVVSANKELIAKYWHEIEAVAKANDAGFYFEASCVGGVPVIRTLTESMQGNDILSIKGIINGTTNYILTKMSDEGLEFNDVLKDAQQKGYAEADPTADVDGFDAAYKLSILSSLAFNVKVPIEKVYREGIRNISKKDIEYGKEFGYELKLLAIGKRGENGIEARVHPTFIKQSHPLASVKESFNAVFITGDNVDDIMLYGKGAGDMPTASAIVSDILYSSGVAEHYYVPFVNDKNGNGVFNKDFSCKYYIRLTVKDKSGVLAQIAGVLGDNNVSIYQVIQKESLDGKAVIVVMTHTTFETAVKKAVEQLGGLKDVVEKVNALIRVE
ncbi:MAG: homoserine dehydrogenase [Clostridia bacterium]|nr:homoserine dehydrogenase [Clostridia bacterium]